MSSAAHPDVTQPAVDAAAGLASSPSDPPLLAQLRAALPALGGGERRVISAMLMHPQDVPNWSTADVAEHAGTSLSTVVRACQRVGFRGYQHIRLEFARISDDAERDAAASDTVAEEPAASAAFSNAIAALTVAAGTIDFSAMDRASALLMNARRILCAATGFSSPRYRTRRCACPWLVCRCALPPTSSASSSARTRWPAAMCAWR